MGDERSDVEKQLREIGYWQLGFKRSSNVIGKKETQKKDR